MRFATHRSRGRWRCALFAALASGVPTLARAEEPPIEEAIAHAEEVEINTKNREVHLRGAVEVALPPFVLRSEELTLARGPRGLSVSGSGYLGFCPCLGTPVELGFDGAQVAPPGDLFLKSPTVRFFGAPVFWLPYFWLRSPTRPGLLPPRIMYRGSDGFFFGGGVQWPFASKEGKRVTWPIPEIAPDRVFVLRAGGYTSGGANVTLGYFTEVSTNFVEWDARGGSGFKLSLTGSDPLANGRLAYDLTAYRGDRAVLSTTDLEQAARAFDRARVETRENSEGEHVRAFGYAGVTGIGARGREGAAGILAGPFAGAGMAAALGSRFAVRGDIDALGRGRTNVDDASLPAVEANDVRSLVALRGRASIEGTIDAGPLDIGVAGGGLGAIAGGGVAADAPVGAAQIGYARVEPSVPLGRVFGEDESLAHRVEPGLVGAFAVEQEQSVPSAIVTSWPVRDGAIGVFGARVRSVLGHIGLRDAWSVDATGEGVVTKSGTEPLVRGRTTWGGRWFGVGGEGGAVLGSAKSTLALGHVRFGSRDILSLVVRAAHRQGAQSAALRLLDEGETWMRRGFLAEDGLTGGATARARVGAFDFSVGSDGDLEKRTLLGVRGDISLQDHCECVAVRVGASQRVGRPGVDAWVLFDFGESVRRIAR